jgi:hypothetical protein
MSAVLDFRPAEAVTDTWLTALRYLAIGRTPEDVRERALEGGSAAEGQMLAIADRMGELAATGLTPVKCWYLGGLDQFLGAYPGTAALNAAVTS